ncbi:hypothetical protein PMI16_02128 [Herbaspirillum sp. CF444]|uniref:hypothetical protein n=1 Tax=Herbaspirillum sp. CF444 TaxID=1144319 RepID=UPI00027268C3|nr:hypothetical protein [Herbaspirillum sp. CF444]EJL88980.1 hypothetical protein PMI16_02128 [Herbaspirillum sp. CF444]
MNAPGATAGFGAPRGRREVADVAEPKVKDKRLDQLLHVRKQRLGRLERERNEAREAWRRQRQVLHDSKLRWRQAKNDTAQQWQQSRAQFLAMTITSGQFRKAKSVYERMKKETAQYYLECQNKLRVCREAGVRFFQARLQVLEVSRQQEKLTILRDEMLAQALAATAEN